MTINSQAVEKTTTKINVYLTRNPKMRVCRICDPNYQLSV
jgi:hypothetical protein